jgi:hypothetical protein
MQWQRGIKCIRCQTAQTLESRIRIPLKTWTNVSVVRCRYTYTPCDRLIPRSRCPAKYPRIHSFRTNSELAKARRHSRERWRFLQGLSWGRPGLFPRRKGGTPVFHGGSRRFAYIFTLKPFKAIFTDRPRVFKEINRSLKLFNFIIKIWYIFLFILFNFDFFQNPARARCLACPAPAGAHESCVFLGTPCALYKPLIYLLFKPWQYYVMSTCKLDPRRHTECILRLQRQPPDRRVVANKMQ